MNKEEEYIKDFLELFLEKDRDLVLAQIQIGLIKSTTIKNYLIVVGINDLQFTKGKSYTVSIKLQAEKYNLSNRRIRFIYYKYRFFKKIR